MRVDTPQDLHTTLTAINERLQKLERGPARVKIGEWIVEENDAGDLIATNGDGVSTIVASHVAT